jgi:hypothetical protein
MFELFKSVSHQLEVSMKLIPTLRAVLVLLLLLPPSASGQIDQASLHVGFHGGLNLAKIGGDDYWDEADHRFGILAGAFLEVRLMDMLAFQPGVSLVQKGTKLSRSIYDLTLKLNYIEASGLAKVKAPLAGQIVPYLLAGPAVGFKIGCDAEIEYQGETESDDCDDDFNSLDLGGVFGAGLEVSAGPGRLTLDARYNLGLLDTANTDEGMDITSKNRAFYGLAGFSIPIGG